MKRYFSTLLSAACLMTALAGCTIGGSDTSSTETTTAASTTTTTTTTTTQKPTTTTTKKTLELNPLTGLKELEPGSSTRAIGIMIGNDSKSRPQYGIDKADWFFEADTEGGITRIMAVFTDPARVPAKLGPVRSARTPFVLLAESLDLIYAHAGGSKAALSALEERDMADMNALIYDGSTFWRDKTLRAQKGYEYSMLTSGSRLSSLAKKRNFRTQTRDRRPGTFDGDPATGDKATTLQCRVSYGQTVNFKYYPEEGLYYKRNGTLGNPSTHATAAGVQLAVSNVVVLFDRRYAENDTTSTFELKSGSGLLFTAGRAREIRWSRSANSLKFTEENGDTARLSTGKTYVCLVDRNLREDTFYRE